MSGISVKQLCFEYLNSRDEGSDEFRRLYRIAVQQGIRKFKMDIDGTFRTQLLAISPNHTVPFPDDYLDYSMVGIVNEHGEGVPLAHNEGLIPIKQSFLNPGGITGVPTLSGITQNVVNSPFFWLNYSWNGAYYHLYGAPGGPPTIGQFDVDEDQRCFIIHPGFQWDSILVEYLTNGYDSECKQPTIHTFAADAFDAFLRWRDNIDKKGVSGGEKERLRLAFVREKKLAKTRLNPVRIQEMEREYRRHLTLVARA